MNPEAIQIYGTAHAQIGSRSMWHFISVHAATMAGSGAWLSSGMLLILRLILDCYNPFPREGLETGATRIYSCQSFFPCRYLCTVPFVCLIWNTPYLPRLLSRTGRDLTDWKGFGPMPAEPPTGRDSLELYP